MTNINYDILVNGAKRFDYHRAMPTPWGKADSKHEICKGVYDVGTPGHGGIMVGRAQARNLLSPEAIAEGMTWGQWICYEEDCDWAIFAYEQPKLYTEAWIRINPISAKENPITIESTRETARKTLERWHETYLKTRESH